MIFARLFAANNIATFTHIHYMILIFRFPLLLFVFFFILHHSHSNTLYTAGMPFSYSKLILPMLCMLSVCFGLDSFDLFTFEFAHSVFYLFSVCLCVSKNIAVVSQRSFDVRVLRRHYRRVNRFLSHSLAGNSTRTSLIET